jgi:hypothetical protein
MNRWVLTIIFSFAFGLTSSGQTASPAPDPSNVVAPTGSESPGKTTPTKKIWTNENLAEVGGKVSVVGDKRNQKYVVTPDKPADPAAVSRIRESLRKLQGQLASVNQRLTSFKEFQEGGTVTNSDSEIPQGYNRVPVNQQIAALEDQKKKLQSQIDDLLDEARKKGVEPGQLR